jgi:hypothetical protein
LVVISAPAKVPKKDDITQQLLKGSRVRMRVKVRDRGLGIEEGLDFRRRLGSGLGLGRIRGY